MKNRRILIAALLLGGVCYAGAMFWVRSHEFAWDFAINWTAARGLRQGISLYDWDRLRVLATAEIGPPMDTQFSGPFSAYISPPSTVLFLLPFSYLPFFAALLAYRLVQLLLIAGALWLAGLIAPAAERCDARLVGALGALYLPMLSLSLWLGQVDGFILVALAISLLSAQHGRWYAAGAAAGVAALFKVSPGLLVVWYVLRGKWRAGLGAALACAAILGLAAVLGQPGDLPDFIFEVAPMVGNPTLHAHNVSLPAFAARLTTDRSPYDWEASLGGWRILALLIAGSGLAGLWFRYRRRPFSVDEPALVIVLALLAGPLTWHHYWLWGLISLVVFAPRLIAWLKTAIARLALKSSA